MKWLYLAGRILFGLIFIISGITGHFGNLSATAAYAESAGVPLPTLAVLVSGVMIVAGALSIWLGFMMEIGTWLLIIFLLAAAFLVHDYWSFSDATMQAIQRAAFMKNLSMAGAALMLYWMVRTYGYGPLTLGKAMAGGRATSSTRPTEAAGEVGPSSTGASDRWPDR